MAPMSTHEGRDHGRDAAPQLVRRVRDLGIGVVGFVPSLFDVLLLALSAPAPIWLRREARVAMMLGVPIPER